VRKSRGRIATCFRAQGALLRADGWQLMAETNPQLALAAALTRRTEQLCIGLEQGIADIYELVTPVTAELLRWWFGDDACQSRTFNFHPGQRQAILNVIAAH